MSKSFDEFLCFSSSFPRLLRIGLAMHWFVRRNGSAGLSHIGGLTGLEWLWLEGTPVSDAGLRNLTGPASLKWLFVRGTRVTDDGVREVKRSWPTLSIRNY
jgi:hypothetical protein